MTESTLTIFPKIRPAVLSWLTILGVATSCDQGSDVSGRDGIVDLRTCADNWRTVYAPEQEPNLPPPWTLGWHGGHLYASVWEQSGPSLISFPELGGEKRTLVQGRLRDGRFWFEGETVLFLTLGDPVTLPDGSRGATTLLESIPATGGPAQVLTTIRQPESIFVFISGWAIDAEHVYSVEGDSTAHKWTIWASPRAGGETRMLATLDVPETNLFDGIQPVGDHLLVYPQGFGADVPLYSIPTAGGAPRLLPNTWRTATLLGVARDGTVLLQRQKKSGNGEPRSEEFEMGRLRPGADEIEPFWGDQPAILYAIKAWDDGEGGFYVHAWEWGPGDAIHATMWFVDAEGQGRRLACDPLVKSLIAAAAAGSDGIYGIVNPSNTTQYWTVVKIAR